MLAGGFRFDGREKNFQSRLVTVVDHDRRRVGALLHQLSGVFIDPPLSRVRKTLHLLSPPRPNLGIVRIDVGETVGGCAEVRVGAKLPVEGVHLSVFEPIDGQPDEPFDSYRCFQGGRYQRSTIVDQDEPMLSFPRGLPALFVLAAGSSGSDDQAQSDSDRGSISSFSIPFWVGPHFENRGQSPFLATPSERKGTVYFFLSSLFLGLLILPALERN